MRLRHSITEADDTCRCRAISSTTKNKSATNNDITITYMWYSHPRSRSSWTCSWGSSGSPCPTRGLAMASLSAPEGSHSRFLIITLLFDKVRGCTSFKGRTNSHNPDTSLRKDDNKWEIAVQGRWKGCSGVSCWCGIDGYFASARSHQDAVPGLVDLEMQSY